MMNKFKYTTTAALCAILAACSGSNEKAEPSQTNSADAAKIWPKLNIEVKQTAEIENRVKSMLSKMTLEQKVAQMIQPEIRDITVEDMRKYGFGSYLNGGGGFPNNNKHSTPADWIAFAEELYQASIDDSLDGSKIPTMWGTDAVHGHNNVIGATLFPHNIGLGATNNSDLIEQIAKATATEVMVTGIDWVFAPTVAVVRDDRWGRTYEGYSEDPEIVRSYAASIVKGLQGHANKDFLSDNRVISTVKHFLGDGGTEKGDDQGDNIASEQELFDIHAQGYVGGLTAGAQSVMASFNSWHGDKLHGSKYLLTDVLKDQMGFDGFVVGDWNGHGQVKGCTNESCPQSVNAGLDIFMVPTDAWKPLYNNTIQQVKDGIIAMSRIDDAVTRILRVKMRAGLFEKPSPANRKFSGKTELIGQESHRRIAQQAVRESLVLLKNKNNLLPLSPKLNVLVAGDAADNIGKQSGGWTITWQGTNNTNNDFPGGSSIYSGIKQQVNAAGGKTTLSVEGKFTTKPDVAIVVFGEDPYAEGHGDRENLDYQRGSKSDLKLLKSLKAQGIPVVSVFISGRPMWVNAELNASNAFVAAWLPGSEGKAVADVLFTKKDGSVNHDFKGKLSYSWPKTPDQTTVNRNDKDYAPLLPYGFGLTYGDENVLSDNLNEVLNMDLSKVETRVFFDGTMHKPWYLKLLSNHKEMDVNASSHKVGSLTYRTIDRNVQEDSVLLTTHGKHTSGLHVVAKSYFREDLSNDLSANSALHLLVNVQQFTDATANIFMNCEGTGDVAGSCHTGIDITELISELPKDSWQPLSIDLQCFANAGVNFSQVVKPFEMNLTGNTRIGLADIMFKPNTAKAATLSCQ
ncbi:exo 1,3/1,4-beta-D-glucan glucohydrolase [Psychrosphaera sp. B3R10]|uniref:glycoside hydrolase family 3 protein n=1 Tax=unclassified Psychrosphaera TaxID=2641570 RepID=UPI001C0A3B72|nr:MULTISPECIES: exo 1,3/1,4-beta-D-glucan glucohydrolase [unclassified Psychrosphaera]MBU2881154.1 exo 1,3/1,4-beta-D-glucan glucohydrolase [Psychrosphaera sp. I2R16]MBU2988259.1 exo 1,3/1,4-beta-D-glucan glucohydrolase [Psychrosphaera sp. B3R10]